MSEEQNKARFYQLHKDDPEVWGEPEEGTPPARTRGLSATITVRFSPEEASEIRKWAQKLDVSYSTIVRNAVRTFVRNASMIERTINTSVAGCEEVDQSAGKRRCEVSLSNYSRTSTQPLVVT